MHGVFVTMITLMPSDNGKEIHSKDFKEAIEKAWSTLPLTHYQRYTRPDKIIIEKDIEGRTCVVLIIKIMDNEFHKVSRDNKEDKREKAILLTALNREAGLITIDRIDLI